MTHLQKIRSDLVVVSGTPDAPREKRRGFRTHKSDDENKRDYLWTARADEPIPLPIQLHYHPLNEGADLESKRGGGRPVLLVHGASAGADTFLTPRFGKHRCLVDHLLNEGYEPWLLDWRGSKDVAETIQALVAGEDRALGLCDQLEKGIKADYACDSGKVFRQLNFNAAARCDIKRALDAINALRPGAEVDLVAHCMGGATVAEALLDPDNPLVGRLSHVVLSTIGIFYEMNLHGRMKAEAHLLKRVRGKDGQTGKKRYYLDPRIRDDGDPAAGGEPPSRPPLRESWPDYIETLYKVWRVPYDEARIRRERIPMKECGVVEMFNRLSFMFGEPYQEGNLAPEIHHRLQKLTIRALAGRTLPAIPAGSMIEMDGRPLGEVAYDFAGDFEEPLLVCRCENDFEVGQIIAADGRLVGEIETVDQDVDGKNGPLLPGLFGAMSLDLFQHGAENLRAGMATRLPAPDAGASRQKPDDVDPEDGGPRRLLDVIDGEGAYEGFKRLDRLTLIGGSLNRLWHRDSIDRMADWLDRCPELRDKFEKHILLKYGHQDLYWGRRAALDVFPKIVEGLGSGTALRPSSVQRDMEDEEELQPSAAVAMS